MRKEFKMQKLQGFSRAGYHGFTLKQGFWYGYTPAGRPAATSTWIADGKLSMHFSMGGQWKRYWIPVNICADFLPEQLIQELAEAHPELFT